jgi:hypothetical protein
MSNITNLRELTLDQLLAKRQEIISEYRDALSTVDMAIGNKLEQFQLDLAEANRRVQEYLDLIATPAVPEVEVPELGDAEAIVKEVLGGGVDVSRTPPHGGWGLK